METPSSLLTQVHQRHQEKTGLVGGSRVLTGSHRSWKDVGAGEGHQDTGPGILQSQEQGTGGLESGSRVCSVTGHLPPDLACRPPPSLGLEEGSHCSLPAVGSVHYEHGNFSASFISCPFARLRPSHTYSPTIGNPRDSLCSLSAHIRKKKKKKKTRDELPTQAGLGSCEGLRPHMPFSSSGKALERHAREAVKGIVTRPQLLQQTPCSAVL